MNYREALNETMQVFGLKAVDVARRTGIGENQISNYRKGKSDMYAENLELIINCLPLQAKLFFYSLLLRAISTNVCEEKIAS